MTNKLPATALLLALMLTPTLRAQRLSADGAQQTFAALSDQFFSEVYFKFSPTGGTSAGLHQYDSQLEDYSAAEVAREVAALHEYEKKTEAIDPSALDAPQAADREILLNNIRSQLLSLEVIRGWEKDPDNYSSGITGSAFVIMERPYASANTRLRALVEREKKMPQALAEARKNLKNPARISTEIALEQIDGDVSFFQNDVPSAFLTGPDAATDAATKAEFAKTNAAVIEALISYGAWMKSDLLPRSNGDFRLGADTFAKKIAYDEMVDIPLDRLLQIAMDDLHKNQAEFARVAKQIDPSKTPQQELNELQGMYPPPDQLLSTFHQTFDSLISFIRANHIITIPSDVQPTLEDTPPFMRATTFASMDPPGPFETHSTKAYFNVTLPEKDWTPEHIAGHMAQFNVGTIVSTSVHEAYPGHYVQFLWTPQFGSKIRKLLGANTNVEGWAHYCEQMMLDQGYAAAPAGATAEQLRTGAADPPGAVDGCTAARCSLRQLHQAAHRPGRAGREVDDRAGGGLLREPGLPDAGDRRGGDQARHRRPNLPLLHPGQTGDHEAARGCEGQSRARRSACNSSTTTSCARASRPSKSSAKPCWATIRRCCEEGLTRIDTGRSTD